MKVPLPNSLCRQISQAGVAHARQKMGGYGWSDKALQGLEPYISDGLVGIRTTLKYLMFQEKGTKPFLMHWVNGRTIPLGGKGGAPSFRRGGHVGEPGFVNIPGRGQVWRDERWKHPGVRGRGFMQEGLSQAIEEHQGAIKAWARGIIGGGR
jgi:hypothetical protein